MLITVGKMEVLGMKKTSSYLMILVLYGMFTLPATLGSEYINVTGLNGGCNKVLYSNIGNTKASDGNVFIVTGLRIEYNGEKSVSVDPSYFQLKLGSKGYNNAAATYYLDKIGKTPLPVLTLYGGGKVEGYIAYEVPENEKDESYEMKYTGWEDVKMNDYSCS
jgi:hypothetical protein